MNLYTFYNKPEELDGYDNMLTTVPVLAYTHSREIQRRFPEGEAAIAKDAHYSVLYAVHRLGSRFPAGEATIATDPSSSVDYARDVLNDRFPEGEAAIATTPQSAFFYARDVIYGRWVPGEAAINTNPYYKDKYADLLARYADGHMDDY